MQFTAKMQDAINEQIKLEMWSANTYLSMSCHFAQRGLNGFAHWYYKQYEEELEHAQDMMKYIITRGGEVKLQAIPAVQTEFGTPLEIAELTLKHEREVSERIEELVRIAGAEKDMPSQDFFWKYIREQVEEEASASGLIDQLRILDGHAILFLDRELAGR